MSIQKEVMFICSGNVFRSVIAERCLIHKLQEKRITDYHVSSAGFYAMNGFVLDETIRALEHQGTPWYTHKATQYTKELAERPGLQVVMCKDIQEYIKQDYDREVPLFNELAYKMRRSVRKKSIMDFVDYDIENPDFEAIAKATTEHIYNGMDDFIRRMQRYFPK